MTRSKCHSYFVRRYEVIEVGRDRGDPLVHPGAATVKAAVAWREKALGDPTFVRGHA